MANKVYLVSSGTYSNYSVHCVFSTKELADEYVAKMNALDTPTGFEVEERELDRPRSNWVVWEVKIGRRGDVVGARAWDYQGEEPPPLDVFYHENFYEAGGQTVMLCRIVCEDEATAVKVANERRTMFLAANEVAKCSMSRHTTIVDGDGRWLCVEKPAKWPCSRCMTTNEPVYNVCQRCGNARWINNVLNTRTE